nr:zinc finger BED domain-containing protein 4-like [Onthophagus taurus]
MKELKEEVRAALGTLGKEDWPSLTNLEFVVLEQLIEILVPMETTTTVISSEKKVTLSSVIIISNGLSDLYKAMYKNNILSSISKDILEKIIIGIDTGFKNMESSTSLLINTFFDPRYKHIGFSTNTASEKARAAVTASLISLINLKTAESSQPVDSGDNDKIDSSKPSIWSCFDKKASLFNPVRSNQSKAIIEIDRYLDEPLLEREKNPLDWWKEHQYKFPFLSSLVKLKFGTVTTSEPCERAFSKTGQIISDRRSRLKPEKVHQIMFLNQNKSSLPRS